MTRILSGATVYAEAGSLHRCCGLSDPRWTGGVDYRDLDAALSEWSPHHGLHVTTKDRGCEVRAIVIADDAGTTYRLWLDLLPDGRLRVLATAPGHRRVVRECRLPELLDALEQVYVEVLSWIEAAGHTRTPVL